MNLSSIEQDNRGDCRIIVACEYSNTVRDAFLDLGYDAYSCDLLPNEPSPYDEFKSRHFQCDVRDILDDGWDLLIVAHPPCTRLCGSGVWALTSKKKQVKGRSRLDLWCELHEGADLFSELLNCDIPHKAIENPVMHRYAKELIKNYRDFSQSLQPWQYGHGETKRTCLWLENLPELQPTNIVEGREQRVANMSPGPDRGKERSRFFKGIADAMASQWGSFLDTRLTQPAS